MGRWDQDKRSGMKSWETFVICSYVCFTAEVKEKVLRDLTN